MPCSSSSLCLAWKSQPAAHVGLTLKVKEGNALPVPYVTKPTWLLAGSWGWRSHHPGFCPSHISTAWYTSSCPGILESKCLGKKKMHSPWLTLIHT